MPEEKQHRKIELKTDEVEEMLGRVPGWITRNGTLLFLFLIALMLFGSWAFKYPDTKKARVLVTSVNPPADIEARTSGKIARLLVSNNQVVESGEVLAMIENPADYNDVILLKEAISFLDTMDISEVSEEMTEMRGTRLGTIQSDYSIFLKAYRDFIEIKRLDYHQKRISLLRSELERQKELARSLAERERITEEEYNLAQRQYNRDADLFIEGVVPQADVDISQSEMLSKRNKWQEIVSLIAENNISVGRIEEQIVDLQLKQQEELSRNVNILEEALNNLKASIARWEQDYLLIAPVSGGVIFTRFWSENQNVEAGEKVLTINPTESGEIVGKINLPTEGAGKVKPGDQVFIEFDNYPHIQYGRVTGYVSNISEVPDGDYYTVEVELPTGLRTYNQLDIPFNQNMQGNAEILTDDLRVIERVLNPLRSAINKQLQM